MPILLALVFRHLPDLGFTLITLTILSALTSVAILWREGLRILADMAEALDDYRARRRASKSHPQARKALVIFLTLLVVASSHRQAHGQESPLPSSPHVNGTPLANKDDQHIRADVKIVSAPPRDSYDIWAFWISVVLAVVGIAGIYFAIRTLNKLERQTKATEDAARATLKQAEHMMSSERAWVVISSLKDEVRQILRPGKFVSGRNFWWQIQNVGKTPAMIIETQAICIIEQEGVINLPVEPEFWDGPVAYQERILAPGASMDFFTYFSGTNKTIFRGEIVSIGLVSMVAYGYVRYRTAFDDTVHESWFCDYAEATDSKPAPYLFRPKLDAALEYTKHT